jgi:hypothetical protein
MLACLWKPTGIVNCLFIVYRVRTSKTGAPGWRRLLALPVNHDPGFNLKNLALEERNRRDVPGPIVGCYSCAVR